MGTQMSQPAGPTSSPGQQQQAAQPQGQQAQIPSHWNNGNGGSHHTMTVNGNKSDVISGGKNAPQSQWLIPHPGLQNNQWSGMGQTPMDATQQQDPNALPEAPEPPEPPKVALTDFNANVLDAIGEKYIKNFKMAAGDPWSPNYGEGPTADAIRAQNTKFADPDALPISHGFAPKLSWTSQTGYHQPKTIGLVDRVVGKHIKNPGLAQLGKMVLSMGLAPVINAPRNPFYGLGDPSSQYMQRLQNNYSFLNMARNKMGPLGQLATNLASKFLGDVRGAEAVNQAGIE